MLHFFFFLNNQASLAIGRKFAFWNDAGAFWELWGTVDVKLSGSCGELAGEVRRCKLAHSQVCLDGEADLR